MAVVTWNGSSSTDFATAANWDTGSVPTASDDVIIPDTSSINKCVLDQARNINSFVLAADGEFDGGNTLFIKGKNAAGEAIKAQGKLGDVTDFTIETASAATIILTKQSGSGSFRNLTITHASGDITLGAAASLSGNLTVTAGELNTDSSNNYALTVTGDMLVAAGGTFTGNSSAIIMRSLELQGAATFSAPDASGSCTINGRKNGTSRCIDVGNNDNNFSGNGGTLTFTSANGGDLQGFEHLSAADELNNLTINVSDGSGTFYLMGDTTVTGNLTITAGTLTTNNGSADKNLTVTGDCVVTGTLTLNDSTVAVGALRAVSGAAITQGSSGTLEITAGSNFGGSSNYSFKNEDGTSDINLGGTLTQSAGTYFDPRTAPTYASVLNNVVANAAAYWVGKVTIGGNYTLNAGDKWETYGGSDSFIVTGSALLNGHLSATTGFLAAGSTGEMKFGGLKIPSGGTYTATPLTTTITNRYTGESHLWKNDGGTYTHNNGTVRFTDNDHSSIKENTFYNVEVASANANQYAVNFEAQGGGGNAFTILGDLTIESGDFELINADDTCDIHGQTIIDNSLAGGSPNNTYARFNNDKNQTGTITHHGIVTVKSGTYHVEDGGSVKILSGFRNVGGVVD